MSGQNPERMTVQMAVALSLLRDGCREREIVRRTGVQPTDLYPAAAAAGIRPGHGTAERALVDQATGDEPCGTCQKALGIRLSRERAAVSVAATKKAAVAELSRTGRVRRGQRRRAAAAR